jgi:hypothetical protein
MTEIPYFHFQAKLEGGATRSHSERPVDAVGNRYRTRLGEEEVDALEHGREVSMSVRDDRWAEQTIELVAGQREYTIVYPPQAQLEVVLTDYLGSGLEGAVDVSAYHESEDGDSFRYSGRFRDDPQPDWLGECRFQNLKPGPNILEFRYTTLDPEDGPQRTVKWSRRTIHLQPGPNRLETALPRLVALELAFPEDLIGQKLHISRIDRRGISESPEDSRTIDGVERFRIPEGEYSVHVSSRRMVFRLKADTRIEFEPTRFRVMQFHHIPADSPLREIGVREKDMVVAIDGESFAEQYPSSIVRRKLAENGKVTLTVLRGEERIDFTLDQAWFSRRRGVPLRGILDPREE